MSPKDVEQPTTAKTTSDHSGNSHKHGTSATFLVCSKALARASRAWKCLLYGGFLESKPADGSQWTVRLPEDKPEPMTVVLHLIHGRFRHCPATDKITVEQLYEIKVLTNKYGLTYRLRPWAQAWVRELKAEAKTRNLLSGFLERCLWITWELGDEKLFKALAERIAAKSYDDDGRLFCHLLPKEPRFEGVLEPDMNGWIPETRIRMVESLLPPLRDFFADPLAAMEALRKGGRCADSNCSILILGSLLKSLSQLQLWPLRRASAYRKRPCLLEWDIRQRLDIRTQKDHDLCRKVFFQIWDGKWIGNHRTELGNSVKKHLESQREQSGLA
ncbi:Uu.00g120300.m01.CDS01 [Anthostomella pinea]|uniref:Uu.00g120300.m01.CDS01 n=1 Tax=Anthostomella pinea TaxID=933095 RepID=A0AAI8YH80_9PEZI|nr:Uu.00g120300.m01.CDS01 [Anthostomella pinea]